jgi:hypothetical protein
VPSNVAAYAKEKHKREEIRTSWKTVSLLTVSLFVKRFKAFIIPPIF